MIKHVLLCIHQMHRLAQSDQQFCLGQANVAEQTRKAFLGGKPPETGPVMSMLKRNQKCSAEYANLVRRSWLLFFISNLRCF